MLFLRMAFDSLLNMSRSIVGAFKIKILCCWLLRVYKLINDKKKWDPNQTQSKNPAPKMALVNVTKQYYIHILLEYRSIENTFISNVCVLITM